MRLFFQKVLIALDQALSDPDAGISIGMIAHLACFAEAEGSAGSVSRNVFALVVANDVCVTAVAFSARIARIHTARDDTACIVGFVLRVPEDAPFHPVGPFSVAPARIRALFRAQVA